MDNQKVIVALFLAVGAFAADGSALMLGEQNTIPPEVLKEMNKQAYSSPNHVGHYINYTDEYVCQQGSTGITLQIIGGENYSAIFGIFHLFPLASNPNVPPGSFVVERVFDAGRGVIEMEPVSWITRPSGFIAVGLRGASTDGGDTFEGQLTGPAFLCSTFVITKSATCS
jgi:hypothetical protein